MKGYLTAKILLQRKNTLNIARHACPHSSEMRVFKNYSDLSHNSGDTADIRIRI